MNALDNQEDALRFKRLQFEISALEGLGYKAQELDLRNYFDKSNRLTTDLTKLSMIWCSGGNAFVLNLAMKLSELRVSILPRLQDGSLAYAGYSAAAVVAGPSLRGIELVDRVDDFPANYPEKVVLWDGLALVDYLIVPHFDSIHSESPQIAEVVKYVSEQNLPYVTLRDGKVIVINE